MNDSREKGSVLAAGARGLSVGAPVEVKLPASADRAADAGEVEVSFVMPCLNEALTIEKCVEMCQRCIREGNLKAEIVVADNGSTDGSQEIARRAGARVVAVAKKGYGNALKGGIEAARGRFIIMGDADQSYDFGAGMPFIEKLRAGNDLVMGSRFNGGTIMPGAMPWKHRWIGNPVLSWVGRVLFKCPVSDFHCGLRGFRKASYEAMDVKTTGMEFASELVIKATLKGMRIDETPITLYKDGRNRPPHLRSWRDGWRHLRFMMCLSPRWTLLLPGLVLMALGVLGGALTATRTFMVGSIGFDVHTLVAASLALTVGYQWVTTAIAMRIFGLTSEIGVPSGRVMRLFKIFTLERGLIAGGLACVAGLALILWLTAGWARADFGPLDLRQTIRPMIIGATLIALGVQTMLMSLVYSMFGMRQDGTIGK